MDAKGFGRYFDRETRGKGMTQTYIGLLIGEWPRGSKKGLNETGIRRIFEGRRTLDEDFIWHLIRTFNLDPDEAWGAARVLPEGEGDHESAVAAVRQYRQKGRHLSVARGAKIRPVKSIDSTVAHPGDTTQGSIRRPGQRVRFFALPRASRPRWVA